MADISNISLFGEIYNIKDSIGRSECQKAINNLNNLSTKKFVFVGDSYAEGYSSDGTVNSWVQIFTSLCGITNFTTYAEGGYGFSTSPSFTSLISNAQVDNDVDFLLVGGGYNDKNYNTTPEAIDLFCQTAKIKYPKATIYIAFFGWSVVSPENQRALITTLNNYKKGSAGKLNVFFLSGVENVIFNSNNYSSDGYHPNQAGQNSIAYAIYQSFCRGYYLPEAIENYEIPNSNSSATNNSISQLMIKTYNGSVKVGWQHSMINFDQPKTVICTGSNFIDIVSVNRAALLTVNTFGMECSIPIIYHDTSGLYYSIPTIISFDNGKIRFAPAAVTSINKNYLTLNCDRLELPSYTYTTSIFGS